MKNNKYARISTIQLGDKLCNIHNLLLYRLDSIILEESKPTIYVLKNFFTGEQKELNANGIREAFINVTDLWEKRNFLGCLPININVKDELLYKNFLNARYSSLEYDIENIVYGFFNEMIGVELKHHFINFGTKGWGKTFFKNVT